jgi:aminopeptidase N
MRLDPHSYADTTHPETASLALRATVDFASRTLRAEATLTFRAPGAGPLDLDTRGLTIHGVTDLAGAALPFTLHPADPILGERLAITLPAGTSGVRIRYTTSPDASALQWLAPAQTAGGKAPFLFSQCQAIHARSVAPLQDTPRLRIRFEAWITVPTGLTAVMAAAATGQSEGPDGTTFAFTMPQPIPPYLLAFAVGDLASRDIGPRSRVWAEPSQLDAAAWEFGDVEAMIVAAEELFGPYDWERFDVLTMPPSFPYGGMENPRLTFLTPTLLAGDRSLVNVLAHELAHSWTGNLVTNANAEHFWLNEGFTVFAERRILEALEGPEMAAMHAALGRSALESEVRRFAATPGLVRLRTHLDGVDPDDAFSQIPYEKGYLFLRTLEDAVGRPAFSSFLRRYIQHFAFQSITTDDFVAFVEAELPGVLDRVGAAEWLDGEGIPANAPRARSERLVALETLGGAAPSEEQAASWTPTEWTLYLDSVPRPASPELCAWLDTRIGASTNYEIAVSWLKLAIASGHLSVLPRVETVLTHVGRMKYLRPLYGALAARPDTLDFARRVYAAAKDGYHPIARQGVEGMLGA